MDQRRNHKGNQKILEMNKNKDIPNLWDAIKQLLRGKFTAINAQENESKTETLSGEEKHRIKAKPKHSQVKKN